MLLVLFFTTFLIASAQTSVPDAKGAELIRLFDKISDVLMQKLDTLRKVINNESTIDDLFPISEDYPESVPLSPAQSSSTAGYTTESQAISKSSSYHNERASTTESSKDHGEESPDDARPLLVGSIRGTPGVHFPDYTDIPITSFSCSSEAYIPGFYADLETGCQVFHVCWPHRRESFLCPIGTTFNQAILACDFWYSSNCSLASYYYNVNAQSRLGMDGKGSKTVSMIDLLLGKDVKQESASPTGSPKLKETDLSYILKFLPVKARVVVYPEATGTSSKIVAEASIGKEKKSKDVKIKHPEVLKPELQSPETGHSFSEHKRKIAIASAKEKADYARHGLSSAVSIVQEVLDFVAGILRETEETYSAINTAKHSHSSKVHKPENTRKHRPLTKLNPRFITKPAEVLESGNEQVKPIAIASSSRSRRASQDSTSSSNVSKATQTSTYTRNSSSTRKVTISTSTKNAIIQNYIRLLQIRAT